MPVVEIYTTRYCPYCRWAKALLDRKGVIYTEIDVGMDAGLRAAMVQRADGRNTVPQVFIGDTHVGGFDDMQALDVAGKLDPMLQVIQAANEEHPA
jgi:glutaredoxin 3